MKRWWILAAAVLPGGALLAAGWWWWRQRATSEPLVFEAVDIVVGGGGVAKVFHDERLFGADPRLLAAFEAYERGGPFAITIVSGERSDLEQAQQYARGRTVSSGIEVSPDRPLGRTVTNARTAAETAHGKRAGGFCAVDFQVVREVGVNGLVAKTWRVEERPDLYEEVGAFMEAHGLEWGGRWANRAGFGARGDSPHVEVKGWQAIPLA